jgi:2-dehydro-3-deoxygalactonokinase
MTGELFELLSTQSILKDSLLSPEKHFYEESFSKGVKQALKSTILNALFSIRANNLLHSSNREENYDLLSGLLIGSELNALRQCSGETIYLVGENPLRHRYIAALEVLEIPVHHIKNTSILTADGHRFMLHHFS